jgi:hypothetical protein
MTVTFCKTASLAAVVVLLTGCSLGKMSPFAMQWNVQKSEDIVSSKHEISDNAKACLPENGSPFHFRKDLFVAGTISTPGGAKDLPGLDHLTSKRLQAHLDTLDRFNVSAMHTESFQSMAASTAARVKQLGREHSSQFVLKLEIEDLAISASSNWLKKALGRGTKRNLAIKLYIYDSEHGALFHSKQYRGTVSGRVVGYPGNGNTVSTAWFNTNLGKKIDGILKSMSHEVAEKLACVPFSSEVIVVKGNEIHIDAGYLHGVRPGETFRAYPSGYSYASQSTELQQGNEVWLKVDSVFPSHSIASLVQVNLLESSLDRGDVVRAW